MYDILEMVSGLFSMVVHGKDHPDIGELWTAGAFGNGWNIGVAHSRGMRDKRSPSLVTNEDSAFLMANSECVWFGVADGHLGDHFSRSIVDLLVGNSDLLLERREIVLDWIHEASDEIAMAKPESQPRSLTTVSAVRIDLRDKALRWMSIGDSTVATWSGRSYQCKNSRRAVYLGREDQQRESLDDLWEFGQEGLVGSEVVVLTTDGWSNFLPNGVNEELAIEAAASGVVNAERTADSLVRQSFLGLAGDHVTAVVAVVD